MYGLTSKDLEKIVEVLRQHSEVEEAVIFGSRAMGNYKPGSDVDLALRGQINVDTVSQISSELNERLPLPYKFDIIDYSAITHQPLIEHIETYGKALYRKNKAT